jgi:hypothetical protein
MERQSSSSPPLSDCVEHVVTKRKGNFDYLKRTHQGKVLWLNTFQLSTAAIVSFYGPQQLQKKAYRYLLLGMSIAGLLNLPTGAHIVQALAQLMEELEHFIGHPTPASKALIGLSNYKPVPVFEPNEAFKPSIQKVNKQVWYQYLQVPTVCLRGSLGYCEVILSLCDCLTICYSKFLDESCATPSWQSIILKIDKKIKTFFLAPLCQDLNAAARPLLERQINGLLDSSLLELGDGSWSGGWNLTAAASATKAPIWTVSDLSPSANGSTASLDSFSPSSNALFDVSLGTPVAQGLGTKLPTVPSNNKISDWVSDAMASTPASPVTTNALNEAELLHSNGLGLEDLNQGEAASDNAGNRVGYLNTTEVKDSNVRTFDDLIAQATVPAQDDTVIALVLHMDSLGIDDSVPCSDIAFSDSDPFASPVHSRDTTE